MNNLVAACLHVLRNNLAVTSEERVLIITDTGKHHIAQNFMTAARQITQTVDLIEMPVPAFNSQEPTENVALRMLRSDVILMPMTRSLSWTQARMRATEKGIRIASMPQITEDIILRTFDLDYQVIRARVNRVADLLDQTSRVSVVSAIGTDLLLDITGRKGRGRKGGIYTEPGAWGNLPCGEAFIAPVEGKASGVFFVDASLAGIGAIKAPVRLTVENGRVHEIAGEQEAEQLSEGLAKVGNPDVYAIAELGIGCNHGAQLCGITLEDEKALGTCHIALGTNCFFGGQIDAGMHIDGVMKHPTIYFDGNALIKDGRMHPDLMFGH